MTNVKRVTLITAAMSVALTLAGCKDTVPAAALAKPPSVPVAEVVVRPLTPFVEYTGSLTAVERVELRPRVAGYIQNVSVPEGRFVEKGSRLFLIDPRVFQAALNAATARLREAEAASMLAQAEHARAQQLFAKNVVARDRLDTAVASLAADRGTGTVRIRAVVDNPDGQLTPGLFAKVKLETGTPQAKVLVCDQSIGTDQGSRYVLVVDKDDKTQYRPVEPGAMVDGLRVVEQGLQPGERIVVKGLVRPGMQVTPQTASIDGAPTALAQTVGAVQ
jgi:gold/copper resistance efflux system membrane fusion protein